MRRQSGIGIGITLGVLAAAASGARAEGLCATFNEGSLEGWTAQAATVTLDSPGADGTPYARCGDRPSPPASVILAPDRYAGEWLGAGQLCLDFILHEDGWPDEVRPGPTLIVIQSDPVPGQGIRALFHPADPITELDGWREFVLPIHPVASLPLPTNSYGTWVFSPPQPDPVAAWNALLSDVRGVHFAGDFVSSPYQTEDFGFDNFCLGSCEDPVSVDTATWGRVKATYR